MYFIQAYAKINLTLDVLGPRPDGYHELVTLMQTVELHDTICLSATDDHTISMASTHPALSNDANLMVKAAKKLYQHRELQPGIAIELVKRIPVAAGLGGGSSNAAAILQAINQWKQFSLSLADLQAIAAQIGSDVPFFLSGGLALCEGRGERVTPLASRLPPSMRWILLVKPAVSIATADVFRAITARDYSDGSASHSLLAALAEGKPQIPLEYLFNGLERSVFERYPQVVQAREAMLEAGAPYVRLSGSGPTLFTTCANLMQAGQIQQKLRNADYEVYLTHALEKF